MDCGEQVVADVNAAATKLGDPNRLVFVRLVAPDALVRRRLRRRQRQRQQRRQQQRRQQQQQH